MSEHVAGISSDGRLLVFFSDATQSQPAWSQIGVVDVSGQAGLSVVAPLVAWQSPDGPGVAEHIAGLTNQGEVIVYFWTTGATRWQAVNVSEKTGVRLAGPLTAWQTPSPTGLVEHLAGVNANGEIIVLFFSPGRDWQAWNLSKPLNYPQLTGRLTSWQTKDGVANIEHLAGRDAEGRVLLWFWPTGFVRTVRVQAVRIADSDVRRQAQIVPAQVEQWIEQANRVYASSGIQFLFVPSAPGSDWTDLANTLLNSLEGGSGRPTPQEQAEGNAIAADHPGKITVFFRFGAPPGPGPSGSGYSDSSYNFVVMPGFFATSVCGHQNINHLAHELGHYLGLAHTFRNQYPSVAAAARALTAANGDPTVFDGDGLADTLPDPNIIFPPPATAQPYQCQLSTVILNGQVFPLPRLNVMSYYDAPVQQITPQQAARVYQVLANRTGLGIAVGTP